MEKSKQSRGWCWTLNNYTEEDIESLTSNPHPYVIFGKETAPETGTKHLQGFSYFPNKATFGKIKSLLPKAHIEAMKGTALQAIEYCKKEGDFVELGEPPAQGKRKDLDVIKEKFKKKEPVRMRDVALECSSYQSVRMAEVLLKFHEPKRNWKPEVTWFYGPTGSGKTRRAME